MRESRYEKQAGGVSVHVRDCYVWAEIRYLDSSTDYREYLPARYMPCVTDEQLTVEAERNGLRWETLTTLVFSALLVCTCLLLVIRS